MKKFLLFLASFFVGLGIFVFILKTVGWQNITAAFLVFDVWKGIIILGLTLLIMVTGSWRWKKILEERGVNVSNREIFGAYLCGFALMFLVPIFVWGGELFRMYFLKEKKGVVWSKSIASVVIDRILEWTLSLIVIFTGGIFFFSHLGSLPLKLTIVFGAAFLFFLGGISLFYFKCIKKESLVSFFIKNDKNQLHEIETEVFDFFKFNKKKTWGAIGIAFLWAALMYLRVILLIFFLGKKIGAASALIILGFIYLAKMIPIPTSLGSHEALQSFAFGSLGLGISTATAFTMIIRGAEVLAALIGFMLLFKYSLILLRKIFLGETEKAAE